MAFDKLDIILSELKEAAQAVDAVQAEQFAEAILAAKKIFVAGAGRSGCIARAFANRLMHLGFEVYFVGDITVPAIKKGDVLVVSSGSGTTAGLVAMAQKAQKQGADIITMTIVPENTIGKMSKAYVQLPGTTRLIAQGEAVGESLQPVGSMFEQLSWLTYDAIIMLLKQKTKQSNEDLIARHGNLE